MLKGRWRALLKKIEQKHTSVQSTVTVACVLHNFCLLNGDPFDDEENRPPRDDPTTTMMTTTQLTVHTLAKRFSYPSHFVTHCLIYKYVLLLLRE